MFFLCVKTTTEPSKIEKPLNQMESTLNKKIISKGKEIAVIIAPNETYFDRMKTTKNTPKQIPAAGG
jgi:hypothetical protein